ncbi:MAG: 6-phosphogluconate dehydrogenase NAD-binding [Verrucomicrobiales bacterium]|nr:6-phosphogluconate dehydrogenase NAD-binding [Verrucomicrobiales bacterium]
MSPPLRAGVAGLGIIGQRVAANLRGKAFPVAVWNRTPQPAEPGWVGTPAKLARESDIIQIFVTDGDALRSVFKEMKPELKPGKVLVNCATVAVEDTHAVAKLVQQTGAEFLDAPFTGSRDAAAAAQLVYYIGGDPALLERVRPVLEASSKEIFLCGKIGDATVLKIATNMVTSATVGILSEAMGIVAGQGVDLEKFRQALERNANSSGLIRMKVASMIAGDFTPHFSLKNMLKDAAFGLNMAGIAGIELPILHAVAESMSGLELAGRGEEDFSVLAVNYLPQPKS